MKSLLIFLYSTLFCCFCCFAASAQTASADFSWAGNYEYGEDGGKNAGGSVIFVQHELKIELNGNDLRANISSQGYQTSKNLNCRAKAMGNKLLIYFNDYGEDNLYTPYKKDDLLLTLERRKTGGKYVILTNWGKFEPAASSKWKKTGVYFTKSKN